MRSPFRRSKEAGNNRSRLTKEHDLEPSGESRAVSVSMMLMQNVVSCCRELVKQWRDQMQFVRKTPGGRLYGCLVALLLAACLDTRETQERANSCNQY